VSYTLIEQALDEVKEFINLMYGACIRFYNTLLVNAELEEMKEDLIERITTMIFYNEGFTDLIINMCFIATQDEEKKFKERLAEAVEIGVHPEKLAVSKYFTIAKNSQIDQWYLKQL
jgi:hypothetical protein